MFSTSTPSPVECEKSECQASLGVHLMDSRIPSCSVIGFRHRMGRRSWIRGRRAFIHPLSTPAVDNEGVVEMQGERSVDLGNRATF